MSAPGSSGFSDLVGQDRSPAFEGTGRVAYREERDGSGRVSGLVIAATMWIGDRSGVNDWLP